MKSLAGAMMALLIRTMLTLIVGRLLAGALIHYYASIIRNLQRSW
jgi:hypothetical protein